MAKKIVDPVIRERHRRNLALFHMPHTSAEALAQACAGRDQRHNRFLLIRINRLAEGKLGPYHVAAKQPLSAKIPRRAPGNVEEGLMISIG